jgi:hypothetical protein
MMKNILYFSSLFSLAFSGQPGNNEEMVTKVLSDKRDTQDLHERLESITQHQLNQKICLHVSRFLLEKIKTTDYTAPEITSLGEDLRQELLKMS